MICIENINIVQIIPIVQISSLFIQFQSSESPAFMRFSTIIAISEIFGNNFGVFAQEPSDIRALNVCELILCCI